jgi:hypothetical protein
VQSPDSMTFSTLNLGMMIEIILGPLASSLRNGTAQGLFAQSPAPRQSGKSVTRSAEAAGRHVALRRRRTKSASLPSAAGNLSKQLASNCQLADCAWRSS